MKKSIYIALLIILGIVAIAGTTLSVVKIIQLVTTNNEITTMEETKLITVDDNKRYENPLQKYEKKILESRNVDEYIHVCKKDDIYFLSTVDEWDEIKLQELANELYSNKHGEEIKYVSSVILYPDDGESYIGTYEKQKENFDIPLSLYTFLPSELDFNFLSDLSVISLYDAVNRVTVEDMAITLSHEYGHHFSEYYFGLIYSDKDKSTKYYNIRAKGIPNIRLDYTEYDDYLENHMWFLVEIAAEDYVYILGSPTAHRIVEFMDSKEKVKLYARKGEDALEELGYYYKDCRNGIPHENVVLPLPDQVDGLIDFYYSFIDEKVPSIVKNDPIGTLNLNIKKIRTNEYFVTWDKPYDDKDVIYTLIAYTENDEVSHIEKTVYGDERAEAHIGRSKYQYTSGNYIYTSWVGVVYPKDTVMKYRVSITFPDGTVIISDSIEYTY